MQSFIDTQKDREETYDLQLYIHKPTYIRLGFYVDSRVPIEHVHITCGHTWLVRPYNLLYKNKCPKCYRNIKKTSKQYDSEISATDYLRLEDYITAKTKILHRHVTCGYEWLVRPDAILCGQGCPKCANYGFQPTKPAYLYYIYFPSLDLYKVGVTNNLKVRHSSFGIPTEMLHSEYFNTGAEALDEEKKALKQLKTFLYNTEELNSGNTETFTWPN